jgi:hypothetical protein
MKRKSKLTIATAVFAVLGRMAVYAQVKVKDHIFHPYQKR